MITSEFKDLHKLAQERTRAAAASVLQLLDDGEERTALLLACAVDFINGAAAVMREVSEEEDGKTISEDQALGQALGMVISSFGARRVIDAFRQLKGSPL